MRENRPRVRENRPRVPKNRPRVWRGHDVLAARLARRPRGFPAGLGLLGPEGERPVVHGCTPDSDLDIGSLSKGRRTAVVARGSTTHGLDGLALAALDGEDLR